MRRYKLFPNARRGLLIPVIIQTYVAFFVQVLEGGVEQHRPSFTYGG